ncbi:monomeric sarcosine oxidase [Amycolatopsis antarctica]|uniref:Monomeric sarcosine oxidase n=1 Tax=Amycolatopsis antarctica TaxID=1854586 RepID=A0A263DAU9_9PSEU|nr:monomeric sarcosine oxidase [Amycolatopsis antarctica]
MPDSARFVIIGAGVHGLSTAWHLAAELRRSGDGDGADVVVLDKTGVGAGASGIACGVVRNNYFQPAMRELMAHSVGLWEENAEALSYHPVGYLQISPERMRADVGDIYAQQQAIGYESTLVEGEGDSRRYLEAIFPDWRARGITSVLHEKRGGYAHNGPSVRGLADKARAEGVRILGGVTVRDLVLDGGSVTAVETDHGTIRCEQVVVAAGPWVRDFWRMLDLPETVAVRGSDGGTVDRPMWTYWALQEGTLAVDPGFLTDAGGAMPPVVHVDSDAPLYDAAGDLVTDEVWGIYFKPDTNFGGVQGGAMPLVVRRRPEDVAVDPYGPDSPDFVVGADFERLWTSALAHCLERFDGLRHLMSREPSGGIGCFTPDSFPVFDRFRENVTVIADSNHGYKMIGVGALVAKEVTGSPQRLLEPFRHSRFARGEVHPVSNSPFPWS